MSNTPQALARVKHSSEEAAQQQQNQNQNPLSCEVCRRRKTKCDRKLPSCTHCIDAKVSCHYPEAKQRGPQVGYLAVLESRLVNTEAALYDALSRLYHHQTPDNVTNEKQQQPAVERTVKILSERYSNMPYSAKTSEWNHQPLLAEEDRQRWWIARQQILAENENQSHAYQHHHQYQHQHQHQMSSPPTAASQQPSRHHRTMSHSSAHTVDTGEPGFVSPETLTSSNTPSTRAAAGQAPYFHHQSPADVKSATASEHQHHPLSSNPSPGVNVPIEVDPEIAAEMDEEQLMKYF